MSTEPDSTPAQASAPKPKARGPKITPPGRVYKVYPSARNTRLMKRGVESLKTLHGVSRLSPEMRSSLAFFVQA